MAYANTYSSLIPTIFSRFARVLKNQWPLIKEVPSDFQGLGASIGDTVSIPIPQLIGTGPVAPGQYPAAPTDLTDGVRKVTISQWQRSNPFAVTSKEAMEIYSRENFVAKQAEQGAKSVLDFVNNFMLSQAQGSSATNPGIYGFYGTSGTNPFATNVAPLAGVAGVLDQQMCPIDERKCIIGVAEKISLMGSSDIRNYLNIGDQEAIRKGKIGMLEGFDIRFDQQRQKFTAGTGTGYLVNNVAGYPIGTQTVACDTGSGTAVVGDIITFGTSGQYKNPASGLEYTYVVTGAQSTGYTSLSFYPPLQAAVADDDAITTKAAFAQNIGYHPDAWAIVARLPKDDIDGEAEGEHFPYVDPDLKYPLLLSKYSVYHASQFEVSTLFGGVLVRPELAAYLAG